MTKTVLEELIDKGYSSRQIAKTLNIGSTTVRYYLKKYGLKTNYIRKTFTCKSPEGFIQKISRYSLIPWDIIQESYNSGLSWKEICIKFSICNAAISWAIKNGKFKTRTLSTAVKLAHDTHKYDYSIYQTKAHRKKMSRFGGLKEKAGRCKKYQYIKKDGSKVWLQGSWELKLAHFLDEKNVKWDKNNIGFQYIFENKSRKYYPDFFVLEKYVEVKGYQTNKDLEKWKQFKYPLVVLKKENLKNLDEWFNTNF